MASKQRRRLLFTFAAAIAVAAGYALLRRWLGTATTEEATLDGADAVTIAKARADDLERQLDRARLLLAEHTATSNENHRLRGAVQALTDALTAMRVSSEADEPAAGLVDALQGEIDGLRDELTSMELQVKELSEDRDHIVEEADRLRVALEAAGESGDAERLGRLRTELANVRRSLDIERQRNLRLGRRRRDL